jgi:signal transduction histidine kinase
MNNYTFYNRFRIALLIAALMIVIASLWYTNLLAKKLSAEERNRMEQLANTYEHLNTAGDNTDIGFIINIIQRNKTIPLILTDEKKQMQGCKNFPSKDSADVKKMEAELMKMRAEQDSIPIFANGKIVQFIFYKDSTLLTELKYFPTIQILIIIVFLIVAYIAFFSSQRSLQNQLWVGMAKETAHQIATPLSSLNAWVEYLKEADESLKKNNAVIEIGNDIERLEIITQRFSKIGSAPELVDAAIVPLVERCMIYMKRRASSKIEFQFSSEINNDYTIKINTPLMEWVMENLLRNALDSMEDGIGKISISIFSQSNKCMIDITDSGKGITSDKYKTVFKPGYSTKKRGWGLGLALCKRIVEEYHQGKIFVKESQVNNGTTFRIILQNTIG